VAVDVTAELPGGDPTRFFGNQPDEALVAHVLQGSEAAFEAIYDRHHRGLIAFCRHMLRSREEAEDALQHTFAAAYRSLTAGDRPNALKPWLYTIARNRCLTVLRSRRTHDDVATAETPVDGAVVEGLSDAVQRRADLRDLVADLRRLPEDQRSALVLFELGDHSHAEIADVLSVNREKVKALVFQAREGLLRARTARDTPCAEIRHHLSSRTRALPRRGVIRGHLDCCPACAAYDLEVRRQRTALAMVLPVVPSLELKGSVLGPLLGGGATVAAGGAAALGTGAAGTAMTAGAGAGAVGAASGAVSAGAAGGALALATGAGSGLTGGAATAGLGALAAKVVTVVAVAGAAAGAGGAIGTMHHRSAPATTLSAPVAAAPAANTVAAPPVTAVVHRPVTPPPAVSHPAPVAPTAATTAAAASGAAVGTASPTTPTETPTQQTGSTPAQDPAAGGSTPATDPTAPADPGGSGSASSTSPDTSTPPADPEPIVMSETADPDPSVTGAGTAADPTSPAPPVTCPAGTAPVDPTVTPTTPVPPTPTDPATPPPAPTVTLPDGTTVPIPDGCALVPSATTAADPAVSAVEVAALAAAAAASDAPPTP
jgi:RNA polymerase sigma factor (sigma-70 family)